MGFVATNKIYNLFIRNLFSIKGRASRAEYITRFTTMWPLGFVANYLTEVENINTFTIFSILTIIVGIIFMLSVIQVFFVTHRRLHDLNSSGWWQLVTFVPFGQLLMIGFIFFKGTQGTNKYGEPPIY